MDLSYSQKVPSRDLHNSSMKNFEVIGHSYFKVPERTDFAKAIIGSFAASTSDAPPS